MSVELEDDAEAMAAIDLLRRRKYTPAQIASAYAKIKAEADEVWPLADCDLSQVESDAVRGWECPKCKRVWNPSMPSCAPCATPGVLWSDDGTTGIGGGT